MYEPEFDEAELMEKALAAYVAELRERAVERDDWTFRYIADEIEGRFLVKFTVE